MNNIAKKWLNSPLVTNDEKNMIKSYSEEECSIFFSSNKMQFGTAGIRSKMGPGTNQFNKFTYRQLSHGYCKYILEKTNRPKIIIAHDNRLNSDLFALECAKVATSFNIEVFLIEKNELKATPIISYLIRELKLDGGIIITASHNPKEYNGFKAYKNNGGQILEEDATIITNYMPESDSILENIYMEKENLIQYVDQKWINKYYDDCNNALIFTDKTKEKKFPIIFTAHHGTATNDMVNILKKYNYTNLILVKEQCYADPNFSNSPSSNPEEPRSFDLALKYAKKNNAKIILGVDPDADRLAVVVKDKNDTWHYLTGNEMGIIFTYFILKNKKFNKTPFIVSTYVSTNLISRIAEKFGAKVFLTGTGFKLLGEAIDKNYKKYDFVVAFEEAIGSLNSTINRDKDSFQASLLALEIFNYYQEQNITFIELLDSIYEEFGYWSGKTVSNTIVDLNWREKANLLMDKISNYNDKVICGINLLKIEWNKKGGCLEWIFEKDIYVKFRLSGTEPKFKVYYNLYEESKEKVIKLQEQFEKYIENILK